MTTFDDIALDEVMSEMNNIIDTSEDYDEIEEELYERGFVESYDDATMIILKRLSFLEKEQERSKNPPKRDEIDIESLSFEDIFL